MKKLTMKNLLRGLFCLLAAGPHLLVGAQNGVHAEKC